MTSSYVANARMLELDAATAALLRVAASLGTADLDAVTELMAAVRKAGGQTTWIEELVLSAPLFVGYPRTLIAAAAMKRVMLSIYNMGNAVDYTKWKEWERRGEFIAHRVYEGNYMQLVENVHRLHPALATWIITEGYGRVLGRPGLDLQRRELCAIAMLVPQGVPEQLHSHLRGAINVGVAKDVVAAALDVLADVPAVPAARLEEARALWEKVRVPEGLKPDA